MLALPSRLMISLDGVGPGSLHMSGRPFIKASSAIVGEQVQGLQLAGFAVVRFQTMRWEFTERTFTFAVLAAIESQWL